MGDIDFNRLNGPQSKILRQTLMRVFRRSRALDMFLEENGYEPLEDIVEPGPFKYQAFDLIRELARAGRLDNLVADVRGELAENPDLGELDGRLALADKEAESQRVVRGTGLERMVRDAGHADVNLWAAQLVASGRRVCRISYQVVGGVVRGTGFLVAKDLVLTNYHVVEHLLKGKAEAADVRLSFGYAETADGLSLGDSYRLAQDWIVAHAPYSQADLATGAGLPAAGELDFALLRIDNPAGEVVAPAGQRGWFDLGTVPEPTPGDAIVFVLQHPEGKPLKQSIGVRKESSTPLRLRYDADTEPGSSGAVVLDQRLEPVALHHAGDPDSKVKAKYNQGIPLALILAALEADPEVPRFWQGGNGASIERSRDDASITVAPPPPPAAPAGGVARSKSGRAGPPCLFYSYAREDEALRDQLAKHLKLLERQGAISSWHHRDVAPGAERDQEINQQLLDADIILLLVSVDFLTSDYIWGKELKIALERHRTGAARVIPIILRSTDWTSAPFSHLQALPRDGRPVTSWADRDEAFADIARALREIAASIS